MRGIMTKQFNQEHCQPQQNPPRSNTRRGARPPQQPLHNKHSLKGERVFEGRLPPTELSPEQAKLMAA